MASWRKMAAKLNELERLFCDRYYQVAGRLNLTMSGLLHPQEKNYTMTSFCLKDFNKQ